MSERFKVVLDHARRYTRAQLYFLPFTGSTLVSISEVNLRWAWLVLG